MFHVNNIDESLVAQLQHLSVQASPSISKNIRHLRLSLKVLFSDINKGSANNWIVIPPESSVIFGNPKDLNLTLPLLWTAQSSSLWDELNVPVTGNVVEALILAGPSGIGKSHLTYLLALRSFAFDDPVLYLPDAGVLLEATCGAGFYCLVVHPLRVMLTLSTRQTNTHQLIPTGTPLAYTRCA